MRYLAFLVIATLIAVSFVLMGCETQNPICSENFCVTGEIFSRAELGDREFSEVDVDDAAILAALDDAEPVSAQSVVLIGEIIQTTIEEILADSGAAQSSYEGKLVEITTNIVFVTQWTLLLPTGDSGFEFTVFAPGVLWDTRFRKNYNQGETYTLQLYIKQQGRDAVLDNGISAYIVEWPDILEPTVENIVSDTDDGNTGYQGTVIRGTGVPESVNPNGLYMTLETGSDTEFWIYPPGRILEGKFNETFTAGTPYTLHLYIKEQDFDEIEGNSITAYLVQ